MCICVNSIHVFVYMYICSCSCSGNINPEHRTKQNNARTPNPEHPEHKPEHVQNPNAEQNNEHEHVFPEPRTLFIASPAVWKSPYLQLKWKVHRPTSLYL